MSYGCLDCDRTFTTFTAVQSHSRAKRHRLPKRHSLPKCKDCRRIFVDRNALTNHLNSVHAYCRECDRSFSTGSAYNQHLSNSPRHCTMPFPHSTLTAPPRARKVTPKANLAGNNWCFACSRNFSSPRALAQHNASPAHRVRTFKCLFCNNIFKTPSSIAMHVESGCHKINRHQVTAAVHKLNVVPQISITRRIEGPIKAPAQLITYSANGRAFNGYAYECYLCHNTFKTLDRLNQHLNSPTHDDLEFRCPRCASEFQLISGLVQHIESGSCGIAGFKEVTKQFHSLTGRFSRLLKY